MKVGRVQQQQSVAEGYAADDMLAAAAFLQQSASAGGDSSKNKSPAQFRCSVENAINTYKAKVASLKESVIDKYDGLVT